MYTSVAVTLRPHRLVCVVDPALAFAPEGPFIVRQLARVIEVWVFRELWHILDNTLYFARTPGVLASSEASTASAASVASVDSAEGVLDALDDWERLRYDHDLAALKLFWVGDGLAESLLPDNEGAALVARFECLAEALDGRNPDHDKARPLDVGFRDTAALAAALQGAFVLTMLPAGQAPAQSVPALGQALAHWQIPCEEAEPDHPILLMERDVLRQYLVQAGLARLCLAGGRLAVVEILAPRSYSSSLVRNPSDNERAVTGHDDPGMMLPEESGILRLPGDSGVFKLPLEPMSLRDPWHAARAVWFPLG